MKIGLNKRAVLVGAVIELCKQKGRQSQISRLQRTSYAKL